MKALVLLLPLVAAKNGPVLMPEAGTAGMNSDAFAGMQNAQDMAQKLNAQKRRDLNRRSSLDLVKGKAMFKVVDGMLTTLKPVVRRQNTRTKTVTESTTVADDSAGEVLVTETITRTIRGQASAAAEGGQRANQGTEATAESINGAAGESSTTRSARAGATPAAEDPIGSSISSALESTSYTALASAAVEVSPSGAPGAETNGQQAAGINGAQGIDTNNPEAASVNGAQGTEATSPEATGLSASQGTEANSPQISSPAEMGSLGTTGTGGLDINSLLGLAEGSGGSSLDVQGIQAPGAEATGSPLDNTGNIGTGTGTGTESANSLEVPGISAGAEATGTPETNSIGGTGNQGTGEINSLEVPGISVAPDAPQLQVPEATGTAGLENQPSLGNGNENSQSLGTEGSQSLGNEASQSLGTEATQTAGNGAEASATGESTTSSQRGGSSQSSSERQGSNAIEGSGGGVTIALSEVTGKKTAEEEAQAIEDKLLQSLTARVRARARQRARLVRL